MRILVLPRDPNPYQDLLYAELQRLGARITYLGELTPSHTLNVLLRRKSLGRSKWSGLIFHGLSAECLLLALSGPRRARNAKSASRSLNRTSPPSGCGRACDLIEVLPSRHDGQNTCRFTEMRCQPDLAKYLCFRNSERML